LPKHTENIEVISVSAAQYNSNNNAAMTVIENKYNFSRINSFLSLTTHKIVQCRTVT